MDDRTGHIEQFSDPCDALVHGHNVPLRGKPDPDCKRCGGTGSRKSGVTGRFVPCRCCAVLTRKAVK